MAAKGIVIRALCTNPSCSFSENKIEIKQALNKVNQTGKYSFQVPQSCPKCKSEIEMLGFVSGSVEIIPDDKEN